MSARHRSRLASVATALAVLAGTSACSGDDPRPKVDGDIVQPGRPGEQSELLDEAPEVARADANEADVRFAQMMIPHHAQALEMAEMAPTARGSAAVRTLADRISGAQRPEIVFMASWLRRQDQQAPTREQIEKGQLSMGGHGHGHGSGDASMPGMATKAQLARLGKARGKAFDRMFLQLMVMHHQGAIEMVDDVLREGADLQINELATGIAADQTAEIDRMRQLLARL